MLRSKVKKKLPALKFLGQVDRRDLKELFIPIKTLNFEDEEIKENDSFEEKWKGKHGERFRKIYNDNRKIVGKFTADFKKALCEVKKESRYSSAEKTRPFISETLDDLKQVIENSRKKLDSNISPVKIVDPIEIDDYIEDEDFENEEEQASATWILLRAKCDILKNSPEEFINTGSKQDNLMSRSDIDWEVLNQSLYKCRSWLEDMEIQ